MIVIIFEVGPILEKAERYFGLTGVFKLELMKQVAWRSPLGLP